MSERGGVEVFEIFFPRELLCCDAFRDFFCEIKAWESVMGSDFFVLNDDVGTFAGFDDLHFFGIDEVE